MLGSDVSDPESRQRALTLTETLYRRKVSTVEGVTVRVAQAMVLGLPIEAPSFEPVRKPADRRTFELLAKGWVDWASGQDPTPSLQACPKPAEFGGALHLMVLDPWRMAIQALQEQDLEEARRMFRRSVELSSQYGTASGNTIRWTYFASFFHTTSE